MKSFFKFTLLSALVITGKLAKQSNEAPVVQAPTEVKAAPGSSVVLVHEATAPKARQANQPQSSGSGLLAEMF